MNQSINMTDEHALETIGKYTVVGTLGRGSMGIVYKAKDPEIGRLVAIKTLRPFAAGIPDVNAARERFKLEARSAGNLRHPNIITVFEVNIEDSMPYLVMDYVEGEPLDVVVARMGRLDPSLALHYLSQIAAGLDYAHSQGVIHRDIKPSNILIDANGNAIILDFGIASINQSMTMPQDRQAKQNTVMGTPAYMSPEQILGQSLDARSDLFSFAVVAFECLTGKRPFSGDNFAAVVSSILNSKPISISATIPELPLSVEAEFEDFLAKRIDSRPRSALEIVRRLSSQLGLDNRSDKRYSANTRQRTLSNWRSFSGAVSNQVDLGHVSTEDSTVEPALPSPWAPIKPANTSHKLVQTKIRAVDHPGRVFAEGDRINSVQRSRVIRYGSSVRILTYLLGLLCLLTGAGIYWTLTGVTRHNSESAHGSMGGNVFVTNALPAPFPEDPDFIAQKTDPVPVGKSVSEMTEREVLGVIVNHGLTEERIVDALREGSTRKIGNFAQAVLLALHHDSYVVRVEAIRALAQTGDPRVVSALVGMLDDFDPLVRGHAARALGVLGSRASLGYLSNRLTKESAPEVQISIKKAIDKINGFPS